MMIGVAVGPFFANLAGCEVKRILELATRVAAVMFILPHCGGLIGKGMGPVSLQLKGLIQKRFPKKMVLHFGIPIIIAYLLISTHFAPLYTTLAARAGAESVRSYAGEITAFTDGGNPVRFWFSYLFRGNIWALVAIPAALMLMYICWRNYRRLTKEASK
jgi:galactitol-specific phosphotransferase system IIC component